MSYKYSKPRSKAGYMLEGKKKSNIGILPSSNLM